METQYDFDDIVNRRNTNCGRWDTMDKKYGTRDMIHLGVADMDFGHLLKSEIVCIKFWIWVFWDIPI